MFGFVLMSPAPGGPSWLLSKRDCFIAAVPTINPSFSSSRLFPVFLVARLTAAGCSRIFLFLVFAPGCGQVSPGSFLKFSHPPELRPLEIKFSPFFSPHYGVGFLTPLVSPSLSFLPFRISVPAAGSVSFLWNRRLIGKFS